MNISFFDGSHPSASTRVPFVIAATTLPVARVDDHRGVAAAREHAVRRLVVRDAGRPFAGRQRPRRGRLPRLDVDHLHRVLALVVHEDMSLAVSRRTFGRGVFELDGGDDIAALGIDRRQRADRDGCDWSE